MCRAARPHSALSWWAHFGESAKAAVPQATMTLPAGPCFSIRAKSFENGRRPRLRVLDKSFRAEVHRTFLSIPFCLGKYLTCRAPLVRSSMHSSTADVMRESTTHCIESITRARDQWCTPLTGHYLAQQIGLQTARANAATYLIILRWSQP